MANEGAEAISENHQGQPHGKLELTWVNKDERFLGDELDRWVWVKPTDFRVAEVRLLHDSDSVGDVSAPANLLICGDALSALSSLLRIPSFATTYAGKVRLAYLDPPFNSQQAFEHYDDALEHSAWLTMMRDRLEQIRDLLAPDGSVWVHLDDSEAAYCRVMMDGIFGRENFVATVVWEKRYSRENRRAIGFAHDSILVYAKNGPQEWAQRRNRLPRDAKTLKQYRNPNNDPRGPWRVIPIDAQGYRPNQMYEIVSPSGKRFKPSKGRCWGFLEERYRELEREGRIYFGKTGDSRPGVIRYLDEAEGLVPSTWWPNEEVGHTDEAKKEILTLFPDLEAFPTPKPERLIDRIIQVSTDPGDLVLDCFLGSGTTAAVAQKLGRRWIGIERSSDTIEQFALPRLTKVVRGEDSNGVTKAAGWSGGGGFKILTVGPSMFAEDRGQVVLADWATNSKLAEATAAQLGFAYESETPFCGRKGRSRLAVIDGHVSEDVVGLLLGELADDQLLVVCGTSLDPAILDKLKVERPGSRARKIPDSLLAEYRDSTRWRPRPALESEEPSPEPAIVSQS